jgi:murein DD-endopeptidase MepM/ murein hydrolase activator NlpD
MSSDKLRPNRCGDPELSVKRLAVLFSSLLLTFLLVQPTTAQQDNVITYTVQAGDTLTRIALKYNLSVAELAAYNGITNLDLIIAGQRLTIPGQAALATTEGLSQTYTVQAGDTLFTIANQFGLSLDQLAALNSISNVDLIQVGQRLLIGDSPAEAVALPAPFESIQLSEPRIIQGRTLVVQISLSEEAALSVTFEDRPVFITGDGRNFWGLVGIHALQDVGVYSLAFRAIRADGSQVSTAQNIIVEAGPYATESIELSDDRAGLLAPEIVQQEAALMNSLWSEVTLVPRWQGAFTYPVADIRITSAFGTRRSYAGGPATSFHAGTDFGGGNGIPIYAPTAGVVVLADQLQVRGNAVLIDHGLGLFSGYWHQSQIEVEVGDQVQAGDLIGYIGDTGLVTGPHLHWEMRLGGIAVEPLQWVAESMP